jgi:hypothetical protein
MGSDDTFVIRDTTDLQVLRRTPSILEYKSRPSAPHPLFRSYIAAALSYLRSMKTTMVISPAQKEMEVV